MIKFSHKPVLLDEVLKTFEYLTDRKDPIFVDGTVGLCGHMSAIANKFKAKSGKFKMIGIDKDKSAINLSKKNIEDNKFKNHFVLIYDDFTNYSNILQNVGVSRVDGVLLDLGVSSMQFDDKNRGFSFADSAQLLDMRMNQNQKLSAVNIVNTYSQKRLEKVLKNGEERYYKKIVSGIVASRKIKRIKIVGDLLDILKRSIPKKFQYKKRHFATATFRALRIEVNDELSNLNNAIDNIIDSLKPKSRLAIITFHSLEDRIVKHKFRELENPCICPPKFPFCICKRKTKIKIITKRPIIPLENEICDNPRSRSAKLRIAERLHEEHSGEIYTK